MSDQKHTPGPWAWTSQFGSMMLVGSYSPRPIVLATIHDSMGGILYPLDPENPDARLIAAAPDLMEACKAARDALYCCRDIADGMIFPTTYEKVEAAIRKAEGGES